MHTAVVITNRLDVHFETVTDCCNRSPRIMSCARCGGCGSHSTRSRNGRSLEVNPRIENARTDLCSSPDRDMYGGKEASVRELAVYVRVGARPAARYQGSDVLGNSGSWSFVSLLEMMFDSQRWRFV